MKLSVKDRVLLPAILPKQGKMIEMVIVRSILKEIEFSVDEIKRFGLCDEAGGRVTWLHSDDIDVNLSEEQVKLLKDSMTRLDESGAVTIDMLDLYEKLTK